MLRKRQAKKLFKSASRAAKETVITEAAADKSPGAPDENTQPDLPSHLVGSYGDPKLWAQSTLKNIEPEKLVEIYAIMPSQYTTNESIRYRMWLHDLLDDWNIPYYIEVGCLGGSRNLTESQHIYVEKKNARKAIFLTNKFNKSDNIVRDNTDKNEESIIISDDGIPQKACPSCGKDIDFDYVKCPHCKERTS